MAYALEADLDATFGPDQVDVVTISDRTQTRDHQKIASALNSASAQINSYIGRRYPVPITPSDEGAQQLRELCCDLAFYRIASTADRLTDIITKRYEAAVATLRDIAAAKADISIVDGSSGVGAAAPVITANEAVLVADERKFSQRRLRGLL